LQIYRDGRRSTSTARLQLPAGAQGNMQTLSQMARIVREDAEQKDVRRWIKRDIIGIENRSLDERINAAFEFCRDKLIYTPEETGFETVADLWSALYSLNDKHPSGDCAVKSASLATMLACFDLKPIFIAVRQVKNVDWFNHVYVALPSGNGYQSLDPTPPEFRAGDEVGSYQKIRFQIFK